MGYILDKKLIPEIASQLQKDYKQVVLTHGTFDLFHIGHLAFLNKSKKEGDILVAGVESDFRIRRMKELNRPVIDAHTRARILTGLNCVDFVFLIDDRGSLNEEFYVDLYKRTKPNVVTYGRSFDYKNQFLSKKNIIKSVLYKEIDSGRDPIQFKESTTNIIHKIVKQNSN